MNFPNVSHSLNAVQVEERPFRALVDQGTRIALFKYCIITTFSAQYASLSDMKVVLIKSQTTVAARCEYC